MYKQTLALPAPAASSVSMRAAPAKDPLAASGWLSRLVATPLLRKLVVADFLINVLAFAMVRHAPPGTDAEIMVAALLLTVVLNAGLVYWALLPLRELEAVTLRVSQGDFAARSAIPDFADRNIARIGTTLNALLDGLTADRVRLRQLASQVISAGDEERAHIARELHDSTAQQLSALEMILASTLRGGSAASATGEQLRVMHDITTQALQEVRTLSHNVHPRVLDDLGLIAALEYLARRTRVQNGITVWVTSDERVPVPSTIASVLYRVAQGAVNNALRHAGSPDVHIMLRADADAVVLEVTDSGAGFDVQESVASRRGMGLFIMRERIGLVDGSLTIASAPGQGTRIAARVPMRSAGVPL